MTVNLDIRTRKEKRASVRLFGTLKYMNKTLHCRVVDLSEDGIGLRLSEPEALIQGVPVSFRSEELGHLTGTVAWLRGETVGLKLKHTSSTYAQVKSYFRFFHEEIVPVIKA